MSSKVSEVLANLNEVMYNPNALRDNIIETLRDIKNQRDFDVLDPNNPVLWSAEASVLLASSSIESHTKTLQRRNPVMAAELEDLYGHMSEEDWIDVFAQPGRADFFMMLGKQEIINKAYPKDGLNVRKLIIPRDTEFNIGGYTFTLQYPIEIRVMPHGGLQVVYDSNASSPIRNLSTRSLQWSITEAPYQNKTIEMVVIRIPALQYKINTYSDSVTEGISWKNTYSYNDQYYTCRVWNMVRGEWVELATTHSDEVISNSVVTAQITVRENSIDVYIPDVYVRKGMIEGSVRVDIYTTQGEIDLDMSSYTPSEYKYRFRDIGNYTDKKHYADLIKFSEVALISNDTVRGGRNALTFEQIRDRCISNNFGARKLPVSEDQLKTTLSDLGFEVTRSVDYVTQRIYLATGDMPIPDIDDLSTGVGTVNGIIETTIEDLSGLDMVKDNGNRVTLLPNTLYRYKQGMLELDNKSLDDYRRMNPNHLVAETNEATLLYTPFHYVIDTNSDVLEARPYYLQEPKITNKRFVDNNNTIAMTVNTKKQSIEMTEYGYRIVVVTNSDDRYKELNDVQLFAQISFTPRGYDNNYAWANGTLLGRDEDDEAVFEFRINTNLDINRNHDMITTNFVLVGDSPSDVPITLDCDVNLIYSISGYTSPDYRTSDIDRILSSEVEDVKAVTYEILTVELGKHLSSLWSNARSIVSNRDYMVYDEDVYMRYPKDVYKKKPGTDTPLFQVVTDENGKTKIQYEYLHRKGDFILDDNGDKKVHHRKGTVVRDEFDKPIMRDERKVLRRLELFMLDAKFLFANTEEVKSYMSNVMSTLLGYITRDLPSIYTSLLEKTEVYFYPKTSMGLIEVRLGDGSTTQVDAENNFTFHYYLDAASRRNSEFLDTISENTRSALLANLATGQVSTSAITKEVRDRLGGEIIDVEMGAFGPDEDQLMYTVLDSSQRPTIGKKLTVNPDWTLNVKDDISIIFNRHDLTK